MIENEPHAGPPRVPRFKRRGWWFGGAAVVAALAAVAVVLAVLVPSGRTPGNGSRAPGNGLSSGLAPLPSPVFPSAAPASPPPNAFDVVKYGADPSGQGDSTAAIRSAIAAAAAAGVGETVYFPAGTYLLNDNDGAKYDFTVTGANAPNILGAGRDVTRVVEKVGTVAYPGLQNPKTVFDLAKVNGTTFSGLTVDTQTYNAGDAIDDTGDNTTIEHAAFLGAQNANTFTMRVIAVCNANPGHNLYGRHHTGNVVNDIVLNGRGKGGNDDLDFSCQWNGTISNITDVGWGTALYIDHNVTVTNFDFTPGPAEVDPHGWYITNSDHITITNFVTRGAGGIIKNPRLGSSDIVVDHEQMLNSGFALALGDVARVTISNSTLAQLRIDPAVSASSISVVNSQVGSVICPTGHVTALTGVNCA